MAKSSQVKPSHDGVLRVERRIPFVRSNRCMQVFGLIDDLASSLSYDPFSPARCAEHGASLPARRRPRRRRQQRERNLYTLCWGKRAAGESSALPRRRLASSPFSLHEHIRVHLGQLLRQPRLRVRLRVADVRVRRRLRGLRPAHAALAPAATGVQPTAPHRVNTSGTRGTPCPLHQHCHSHRNAS